MAVRWVYYCWWNTLVNSVNCTAVGNIGNINNNNIICNVNYTLCLKKNMQSCSSTSMDQFWWLLVNSISILSYMIRIFNLLLKLKRVFWWLWKEPVVQCVLALKRAGFSLSEWCYFAFVLACNCFLHWPTAFCIDQLLSALTNCFVDDVLWHACPCVNEVLLQVAGVAERCVCTMYKHSSASPQIL